MALPSLDWLLLENVGIDVAASRHLAQGQWPLLSDLYLSGNNVCISYLEQDDWPLLSNLNMSAQCLDEEASMLFGITHS